MARKIKVVRQKPELVIPARPTPRETKPFSDIEDHESLRFFMPSINSYRRKENNHDSIFRKEEEDPVKVIKAALAETLVFYYPFAGRLKENPGGKVAVDCTAEGMIFVEADANVTLEDLGEDIQPRFTYLEELFCSNVPNSNGILHSPLLFVQVTRLRCGGLIFARSFFHTLSDAVGNIQFEKAVAEIAREASAPTITPVWMRERLKARYPPRITCINHQLEHEVIPSTNTKPVTPFKSTDMVFC